MDVEQIHRPGTGHSRCCHTGNHPYEVDSRGPLPEGRLSLQANARWRQRIVRLPDMDLSDPLEDLRSQIAVSSAPHCPALAQNNLLPFGQDGNDGGPKCFKTDQPTGAGDYPVYFADHKHLSDPSHSVKRVWNSFAHLLNAIEADILSYD